MMRKTQITTTMMTGHNYRMTRMTSQRIVTLLRSMMLTIKPMRI